MKTTAALPEVIFACSWEHLPAPRSTNLHGFWQPTGKTQRGTENMSRICDKTSTCFMPQPGLTSTQGDINFSLKTEETVSVYKAEQI